MSVQKRNPVPVPIAELRALQSGWRKFLADDGEGYEPLAEAVQALLVRLAREASA